MDINTVPLVEATLAGNLYRPDPSNWLFKLQLPSQNTCPHLPRYFLNHCVVELTNPCVLHVFFTISLKCRLTRVEDIHASSQLPTSFALSTRLPSPTTTPMEGSRARGGVYRTHIGRISSPKEFLAAHEGT